MAPCCIPCTSIVSTAPRSACTKLMNDKMYFAWLRLSNAINSALTAYLCVLFHSAFQSRALSFLFTRSISVSHLLSFNIVLTGFEIITYFISQLLTKKTHYLCLVSKSERIDRFVYSILKSTRNFHLPTYAIDAIADFNSTAMNYMGDWKILGEFTKRLNFAIQGKSLSNLLLWNWIFIPWNLRLKRRTVYSQLKTCVGGSVRASLCSSTSSSFVTVDIRDCGTSPWLSRFRGPVIWLDSRFSLPFKSVVTFDFYGELVPKPEWAVEFGVVRNCWSLRVSSKFRGSLKPD